jgi:hypothetical protein
MRKIHCRIFIHSRVGTLAEESLVAVDLEVKARRSSRVVIVCVRGRLSGAKVVRTTDLLLGVG